MDLLAIIRSVVKASIAASMQGVAAITTAAVEARSAADDRWEGLSPIMQAHLRHICGVAGDKDITSIWRDMLLARTESEGLALMSQLFLTEMSACLSKFHDHADLLHVSLPLFILFMKGAFTNHNNHMSCLSGGISDWTSLQGLGGSGCSCSIDPCRHRGPGLPPHQCGQPSPQGKGHSVGNFWIRQLASQV